MEGTNPPGCGPAEGGHLSKDCFIGQLPAANDLVEQGESVPGVSLHGKALMHQVGSHSPGGDPEKIQTGPLDEFVAVGQHAHQPQPDRLAGHDYNGADHSGFTFRTDIGCVVGVLSQGLRPDRHLRTCDYGAAGLDQRARPSQNLRGQGQGSIHGRHPVQTPQQPRHHGRLVHRGLQHQLPRRGSHREHIGRFGLHQGGAEAISQAPRRDAGGRNGIHRHEAGPVAVSDRSQGHVQRVGVRPEFPGIQHDQQACRDRRGQVAVGGHVHVGDNAIQALLARHDMTVAERAGR